MKLLLAEDSDVDARILEAMLRSIYPGLELRRTTTLRATLDAAGAEEFSAVLLDLTLDDSLGLDTLSAFLKQCPGTPAVVVSGEQDEVIQSAALAAGARAFLCKKDLGVAALERLLKKALA